MKTVFTKPRQKSQRVNGEGFTLLDLLVVIGVIAVLLVIQLPVLAGSKSQSKIAVCADHVRQLALACQIYANDNQGKLPVLTGNAAVWAWDLPPPTADALLSSGVEKRTFYCPGTAPRFTDWENFMEPGAGNNLWDYYPDPVNGIHVIGYSLALSGLASKLYPTNQNTTIQPETIKFNSITIPASPASERVLVADATLSAGATLPGYAHPENNYVTIYGGFQQNGVSYPHVSPHLKGVIPTGGNLGFKDGHVAWQKFELMTPRSSSGGRYFWW